MASKKVTPEQAAVHVYNVSHGALEVVSSVYKNVLLSGSRYLDEKTDNALGRLSGAAYMAKTLHAVVGGFKDVETQKLKEILLDGKMNFKDKIKESVKHVHDKFSHESTVAATMFFGKEALVIAPIALGVTALVGLAAPAAAATAGLVAGMGLMKAATYFLSTHAGHKLESTMAEKISAGMKFLTGFRKAGKGQDPEMNQVHEIAEKMEHAAKAHGHGVTHGPGATHQGHHHGFSATLKQDLVALARVDKYPAELANFAKGLAKDCVSLFNKVSGKAPVVVHDVEAKATTSKFVVAQQTVGDQGRRMTNTVEPPKAPAEVTVKVEQEKNPTPQTKKSQPMKPRM